MTAMDATQQQLQQAFLAAPSAPALALGQPTPAVDQFFADEAGLITVFDFDYDSIISFRRKLQWMAYLFPPTWISVLTCTPCFLNQNVEWQARAQHVALTVDGIRFVRDKRKSMCGLPCSDVGKESKTVPYDKITDCDVQEPAGMACCCCIQRVLSQVNIDTASSRSTAESIKHELVLEGLRYPTEFKQAVWAMKRGEIPASSSVPLGPTASRPQAVSAPAQESMTNTLLMEIRDELKELNANMKGKA